MENEFKTLIDDYNVSALQSIAQAANLPVMNETGRKLLKKDLVELLARELLSVKRIQAAYSQLNDTERAALDNIRQRVTPVRCDQLRRQLIAAGVVRRAPTDGSSGYPRAYEGQPTPRSSRVFEDVLARLTQFGLVFSVTRPSTGIPHRQTLSPGRSVFVPEAIARHLPPLPALVDQLADWQPTQTDAGDPLLVVRELYLYWDFCRRNTVTLLKSGQVAKRSFKAISEQLIVAVDATAARSEADLTKLYWLRETLQQQGMLKVVDDTLQAVDKPQFWHSSLHQLVQGMLGVWRRTIDLLAGNNRPPFDTQPVRAFDALLQTLVTEKAQRWIAIAGLAQHVSARVPNFYFVLRQQLEESSAGPQVVNGIYYSDYEKLLAQMDALELAFVQHTIMHALLPLGIVEVGTGQLAGNPLQALRLTAFGRAVLLDKPYELPGQAGRVIVQPTFQLLALGQVPLATLSRIDRFADRVKVDRNVFEYILTHDSVYAAQQNGMGADEVIAFLTQVSDNPLPQNVHRSLLEWGARHERIVFRTSVTLVQTGSTAQLDALLAAPASASTLGNRLGDRLAVVHQGKQPLLTKALLADGVLPLRDRGDRHDNSVSIAADGRITLDQATPSLFLSGRLAQIAEPAGDGTWRITRRSVERHTGSRAATAELLAELARLHNGTLPAELVRQIKVWCGYYGTVAIGTLTLIAFEDAATLAELAQHPSLKGVLAPFPGATRPLAVIPVEAVARVRAYLQQLGVTVSALEIGAGGG